MLERKSLTWFLIIAFLISWSLFLIPLLLNEMAPLEKRLAIQGLWAAAMWGPGVAALITTLWIARRPLKSLRLNTLGPRRYYLWAWFLPFGLTVISGLLTVSLGIGRVDPEFTLIRESMASTPGGDAVPPGVIVLIQILFSILLAPLINILFALGEELGWRGFLLPALIPLGQWKAIVLSGFIWGVWHAPAIVQGLNYPGYPIAGIPMMIIFCILLGVILSWLYLNTGSPWVAALGHGAVNAAAGLPLMFLQPEFKIAFGGTIAAPTGWLAMILFIAWLTGTKRLPVRIPFTGMPGGSEPGSTAPT